eukprot:m.444074 g.444074  ORF g.444074 m.444074 type:complete len:153 (+) comp21486_c0_seq2:204-662(+)
MAGTGSALTENEISKFTTAFYSDVGDGIITLAMLKEFSRNVTGPEDEIPEAKLDAILRKVQAGNATANFGQMLRLLADEIKVPSSEEELLISFKAFDQDRDGKLTSQEMIEMLQSTPGFDLSQAMIEDIVRRCDVDGSGLMSFADMTAAMKH